jgi:DNA-binding transcriptional regulator LsrR (DeoR family)
VQQINIIKQLAKTTAEVGCEAGDLAHLFYNDRDRRQRKLSPDRLKVCRAKAKRAIHSLKERGLVDIFYSQSLAPTSEYQVQKLFVELTQDGQAIAS